jgi:protocatechuate 3,4-dioxygenase alpha subunit
VASAPTPSQTVGPFFHIGLPWERWIELVAAEDPDALRLEGVVYDGTEAPIIDAMVEIWQANRHGRYAHPEDRRVELALESGFSGFGRCATDLSGRYGFTTVKPGVIPGPNGTPQAPHIEVSVFARGLLKRVVTRIYFPDEREANASDPALNLVDPASRERLVARAENGLLRFDIHLQGDHETPFFGV